MAYTNVGAIPMGSSGFDAIKTIQYQKHNVLSSSSFAPKSQLQRLVDWLVSTVCQKGNPL